MAIIGLHIDSTPNIILAEINKYNNLINKYSKNKTIIQLFVSLAKSNKNYYDLIKENFKNKILFSVHISYTINIAKDSSYYNWWIKNLVSEIKIANDIGAFCVVIHLGKSLDLSLETAFNNMYINL